MKDEAKKLGLNISWAKTNLGVGQPVPSLGVDGEVVKAVTDFRYLGSVLTSNAGSLPDVAPGITSAAVSRLDRI